MADDTSPSDSELTREQETAVRRLLAQARHDEPMPGHVAERLDRTLAKLTVDVGADQPAVDLAARRRRRNAGRLLLAAAAVVVGGVAVGQVVGPDMGEGGADSGGADPAITAERDEGQAARGQESPTDGTLSSTEAAPNAAEQDPQALAGGLPVQLHAQTFDEDVRRIARQKALSETNDHVAADQNLLDQVPAFRCPPAAYGKGTLLPAYYDSEPTVLAFRPALGSQRLAVLLRCGTAERLRSVTLNDADQR